MEPYKIHKMITELTHINVPSTNNVPISMIISLSTISPAGPDSNSCDKSIKGKYNTESSAV